MSLTAKTLTEHRPLFESPLAQTISAVYRGTPGREAFRTLLREMAYNMPSDSQIGLSGRLWVFHVAAGKTYDTFCLENFVLLDEIGAVGGTSAEVETSYVIDHVRYSNSHQFPGKNPSSVSSRKSYL